MDEPLAQTPLQPDGVPGEAPKIPQAEAPKDPAAVAPRDAEVPSPPNAEASGTSQAPDKAAVATPPPVATPGGGDAEKTAPEKSHGKPGSLAAPGSRTRPGGAGRPAIRSPVRGPLPAPQRLPVDAPATLKSTELPDRPAAADRADQSSDTRAAIEALLGDLHIAAEHRKGELRDSARGVCEGLDRESAARQRVITMRTATAAATIRATVAHLQARLTADAAAARKAVAARTQTAMQQAGDRSIEFGSAVNRSAQQHKKKASDAVAAEQQSIRQFGAAEGKRAKDAMDQQARDAWNKGQAKAAGYPDDARVMCSARQ